MTFNFLMYVERPVHDPTLQNFEIRSLVIGKMPFVKLEYLYNSTW